MNTHIQNRLSKITRKATHFSHVISSYIDWKIRISSQINSKSTNYQKFLIVGEGRTGTNMLVSALQKQNNIVCFGELFHNHSPIWSYKHLDQYSKQRITEIRNNNLMKFINEYVWTKYNNSIDAVGFKAIYWHIYPDVARNTLHSIINASDINVIHVWRKDLFQWYVSLMLAEQTHQWVKSDLSPKITAPRKIKIDIEHLESRVQRHVNMRSQFFDVFKDHPTLSISYEDMANNMTKTMKLIKPFLSLPPTYIEEFAPSTIKQQTLPLHKTVENYDEVTRSLSNNSNWASIQDMNNDPRLYNHT